MHMIHKEQQVSTEIKYKGRMLTVKYDVVRLSNGHSSWREVVRHPGAAAIVVELPDGTYLLETQYRYASDVLLLEIPAGKLDPGEHHADCAKRELLEETGYEANTWTYLGPLHISPGFCDELIHLYLAQDVIAGNAQPDEDEFIEMTSYAWDEVWAMIEKGRITDAKTIAAFAKAMPYVKKTASNRG